ncbi:uncharacterized protein LOC116214525 [Punica granatum]|uniref:Uncharacterized protein LOC116214525 n=2 Tax=Punica granatum TaxID=22663 RepID=A0A6P8EJF0_PUNGR|nr:uncharacterized protein LOC116214525 [Punica granatum]
MDRHFDMIDEALSVLYRRFALLQSQAMAKMALDTRINKGITPALALLDSSQIFESLQDQLLDLSSRISSESSPRKRLRRLNRQGGWACCTEVAEVVEFLSRTMATDQFRTHRLRETLNEFESMLRQLTHQNIWEIYNGEDQTGGEVVSSSDLVTEQEIEVLCKISEMLMGNDGLGICMDIFVKFRYNKTAKALRRLNSEYLKAYTPKEIEKLCSQVLGGIMEVLIWPACSVKNVDKFMAVLSQFVKGVRRRKKGPKKLFKLLDMFDSLENLKLEFLSIFDGEAGGLG